MVRQWDLRLKRLAWASPVVAAIAGSAPAGAVETQRASVALTARPTALGALQNALAATAAGGAPASDAQQPSVALAARPTVLGPGQLTTLRGAISSQREREQVELRVKDCGQPSTRSLGYAYTGAGGTFEQDFYPGVNATVTAHWNGAVSAPVQLRQEPYVRLFARPGGRFEVGVNSKGFMWRKKVTIQRRAGGKWVAAKTVVLASSETTSGQGGYSWNEAEFRLRVPRGSTLRAVLPRSQAKPCYLATTSKIVRT